MKARQEALHSPQELFIFATTTPPALEVSLPGPAQALQHRRAPASPVLPLPDPHWEQHKPHRPGPAASPVPAPRAGSGFAIRRLRASLQ